MDKTFKTFSKDVHEQVCAECGKLCDGVAYSKDKSWVCSKCNEKDDVRTK